MQQAPPRPPDHNGSRQASGLAPRRLLSTRSGTVAVAIAVALLGAGAVLVFLQQYRDRVDDERRPATVLVAKKLIGAGTSGEVVATEDLFQTSRLAEGELKQGAIRDPSTLRGRVAERDIFPGQQLTEADFARSSGTVGSRLTRFQRAVSVPVDAAHGLVGKVRTGDRVDVYAGFTIQSERVSGTRAVLRTLVQDVLVLDAPAQGSSRLGRRSESQIVLRVTDEQAAALAYSAEYGEVWIALRPPSGAQESKPSVVTLERLLSGVRPLTLQPKEEDR